MAAQGNSSGFRGGFSTSILTRNLMEDPRQQRSLRGDLLEGIKMAQKHKVHAGPEYRNYKRSHPLEGCRGVVR